MNRLTMFLFGELRSSNFQVVKRFLIFYFLLKLCAVNLFAQSITIPDSVLFRKIESENFEFIDDFIKEHGIDYPVNGNTHTILSIAVRQNSLSVVKYLLNKGADLNNIVNNLSPLMHCAINDRYAIASLLIKNGAKVDLYNTHRNTPLLFASRYGNLNTVKVLTQNRANPFFKNFMGYNSFDYAVEFKKDEVVEYLRKYMERYVKGAFPSTFDGLHIEWNGLNRLRAFYLVNDSINGKLSKVRKSFRINNQIDINGFFKSDTFKYRVFKPKYSKLEYQYKGVSRVFAVGDVHGAYDSLISLLRANGIIDVNLNWSFGDGHLVFIGDLFDRGDKVTEVLWFVYKLYNQATLNNGKVHVLLGNHELLILNKDYRYLNEKYVFLTRGLDIDYRNLFTNNTILGNFIRSFKVAVQIDSVLFVHAGISSQLVDKRITIEELNRTFNQVLNQNNYDVLTERNLLVYSEAISDRGPFWYRGYVTESNIIPRATQNEIEKVVSFYGVNAMVVGHTEVLSIDKFYNGRLFPINVPFDRAGIFKQGLKIEQGKFFICNSKGVLQQIH